MARGASDSCRQANADGTTVQQQPTGERIHYQFSTGVSVSGAAREASTLAFQESAAPASALRPNWLLEGLPSSVEEALALRKLGLPDPQVLIVLQTEAESPAAKRQKPALVTAPLAPDDKVSSACSRKVCSQLL